MHTRALRRLGLVAMALATLGGCVAADYWPYTGSYYLALLWQIMADGIAFGIRRIGDR